MLHTSAKALYDIFVNQLHAMRMLYASTSKFTNNYVYEERNACFTKCYCITS